jgi:hypothetical protein
MKQFIVFLFSATITLTGFTQNTDIPDFTGDNFSLEGALVFFKQSNNLEEFEKSLNEENNNVNNLDLNNDGEIDYILVDEIVEGETHVIVLSTFLNENEKQDIAAIGIEKTGNENAILQIEGDPELYAANTIIEPADILENQQGNKGGPYLSEINYSHELVNVWFWPTVRFIYTPGYVVWHSPWKWGHFPKWWKPWRPFTFPIFYGRCASHKLYFHPAPVRRVVTARKIYIPRRNHSTLVIHQNRRPKVIKTPTRRGGVVRPGKRVKVRGKRNG